MFQHYYRSAGGGAVDSIRGELKTTNEVSLNRAWRAAQMAMSDLEFTITDKEKDAFDGRIHASGAGGKAINVAFKKISPARRGEPLIAQNKRYTYPEP